MNNFEKEIDEKYNIELGEGEYISLSNSGGGVFDIVDFKLKNYNKKEINKKEIAFFHWDEQHYENLDNESNVFLGLDGSEKLLFKNKNGEEVELLLGNEKKIYADDIKNVQEALKHVQINTYDKNDYIFDWLT